MALVFANLTRGGWIDVPLVMTPASRGYGKYRVFHDTIDLAANPAADEDFIVMGSLTVGANIWTGYKFWCINTAMPDLVTITLGTVSKRSGQFTVLSLPMDLSVDPGSLVGWDGIDPISGTFLPRPTIEESWLGVRVDGGTANAGVLRCEIPVTVE